MSELTQDIDERAMVSWLRFERDMPPAQSPEIRALAQSSFITGYKMALWEAVLMRLDEEDQNE